MKKYTRHRVIYHALRVTLGPIFKRYMHYAYQVESGLKPPYLVLANHATNLDPVLLGITFPHHMYFVASEHIFRLGIVSRLLQWALAPIARQKGSTDALAVMQILRKLRQGANVGMFAEGNRTFTGCTGPILPSTGKLAKAAGVTVITYKLEGGYLLTPRWGYTRRKGPMRGHTVNVYTPEQLREMSVEQVQAALEKDLAEDAIVTQQKSKAPYHGKRLAERLELSLYICPKCGGIATLFSEDDVFGCTCGLRTVYTEAGVLTGEGAPFSTVAAWDDWQRQELARRLGAGERITLKDRAQTLREIYSARGSRIAASGDTSMDTEYFCCGDFVVPVADISNMAIRSKMSLVFTTASGAHYELNSSTPRSAVKYLAYYGLLKKER